MKLALLFIKKFEADNGALCIINDTPSQFCITHFDDEGFATLAKLFDLKEQDDWTYDTTIMYAIAAKRRRIVKYLVTHFSRYELNWYARNYNGKSVGAVAYEAKSKSISNLVLLKYDEISHTQFN